MSEIENRLINFVHKGKILEPQVRVPLEEEKEEWRFRDILREMFEEFSKPNCDVSFTQKKSDDDIDLEIERLKWMRPYPSIAQIPINFSPAEKMNAFFWGSELLDMSLLFITGKSRFTNIVPDGLSPNCGLVTISIAGEHALYVMSTSSLYWAQEEGELSPEDARNKVTDMAWAFRLNPESNLYHLGDTYSVENMKKTLDAYHGKYPYYEPKGSDGSEMIKIVRKRLKNQPISIPEKLDRWITNPLLLLDDYGIDSHVPIRGELSNEDKQKYITLK